MGILGKTGQTRVPDTGEGWLLLVSTEVQGGHLAWAPLALSDYVPRERMHEAPSSWPVLVFPENRTPKGVPG